MNADWTGLPNVDRWMEVDRLFLRALDLPLEERESLVRATRRQDPLLADELEELLKAVEEEGEFLERGIEAYCNLTWSDILAVGVGGGDTRTLRRSRRAPEPSRRKGSRIGPYRILRMLGRGGMAAVYLAERADGEWEQKVAVKILHRGMETQRVLERFRDERQILSTLQHPNIARFLGGGTTDDGLPYLVMEYVSGTPIVAYCDERDLSLNERLDLFCDVGRAVQAAHRRLVVHRDLKPSNVLVDREGRVKLLDFGIAKLLDGKGDPVTTRLEQRVLTPAYASPEQVTGGEITTASDVYQLGILLCELLTGRRPYEVKALSPAAAEQAIITTEPTRPSALVEEGTVSGVAPSPVQYRRRLIGDLDNIVLMALQKDPEGRYPSAGALVDDVLRHRRGLPVVARANTLPYRAGKFLRRHRVGFGVVALLFLFLAAAAGVSQRQAHQAELERDRARVEQARAETVTGFIVDLLRVADPNVVGADAVSAFPVLDMGVELARTRLADDPLAQAQVLGTIGSLYSVHGRGDQAVEILEEALEVRGFVDEDPLGRVNDLIELAWALGWHQWEWTESERTFEEAIAVAEAELGPNHPRLAAALGAMADLPLGPRDGRTGAERRQALVGRALAILRQHDAVEVVEELADALYIFATGPGAGDQAIPALLEALELRREVYGPDNLDIAVILNDLALMQQTEDPVAADTLLARAVEMHVRLLGLNHQRTLTVMNNRAGVLREWGRFDEAEVIYRNLLDLRTTAFPADSVGRAYILHGLGWVLAETGRAREAEDHLKEMMELLAAEGDDWDTARFQIGRSTLGRALAKQDRLAEAEPLLTESYAWFRERDPDAHIVRFLHGRVVELYEAWGRQELAERYRQDSL